MPEMENNTIVDLPCILSSVGPTESHRARKPCLGVSLSQPSV